MRFAITPLSLATSFIIGGTIGYLGGPALVLLPWALVALFIGALAVSKKAAAINGAVYGFMLAYIFMLAGYNGQAPLTTKLVPFILFGLVGAVCGSALAFVAVSIKKYFLNKRKTADNER